LQWNVGWAERIYQWYLQNLAQSTPFISQTVTFDAKAQGSLAMVIYEWKDVQYLGKETSTASDEELPVSCSGNAS